MCLTQEALVRLLNNHGPDFQEQWELPVWVKLNPAKGTALSFIHKSLYKLSPWKVVQLDQVFRQFPVTFEQCLLSLSFVCLYTPCYEIIEKYIHE